MGSYVAVERGWLGWRFLHERLMEVISMKDILALIGVICMLLASAVTILLPLALALWVNPVWLWLYAVYILITIALGIFTAEYTKRRNIGGDNG